MKMRRMESRVCSFTGESHAEIPPEWVGSIDSPSVQNLVEETLEGGREAFETRRLKYGFGMPDAGH